MKKRIIAIILTVFCLFFQSLSSHGFALRYQKYQVKELPYQYDSLEPYIDEETMILHHDKHYQTYVNNLNTALDKHPELYEYSLTDLLKDTDSLPKDISNAVINNGGGVYNHEFFFDIMTPEKTNLSGNLKSAITRDFGSLDNFKSEFSKAALSVFGSGWAWLVSDSDGKLSIITTKNQDNPISLNLKPIIGIDVWEHAYYLKYKNERSKYIDNWFNLINWDKALTNYSENPK